MTGGAIHLESALVRIRMARGARLKGQADVLKVPLRPSLALVTLLACQAGVRSAQWKFGLRVVET